MALTDSKYPDTFVVSRFHGITVKGDRLFDVTVHVEDGQEFAAGVIAADREGQATTTAMAFSPLHLNGQDVTYEVKDVTP